MSWWTLIGFRSVLEFHKIAAFKANAAAVFLLLDLACIVGLIVNLRKVAHYNRNVFPRLRWNWEHTYVCRRCGRTLLIPS
jgi:hypothetical protein